MADSWRIILLLLPLLSGAIAIFLAFQLMKRYEVAFVNSYFYYLVFLYIFGSYTLAGSGILEHLLIRMDADLKMIHSAKLYTIFLGIPFLALSNFMLLRSTMEFFAKRIASWFTIFYFLICMAAFVLYGIYMVRFNRFDMGEFQLLIHLQRWGFIGFIVVMYMAVFLGVILYSRDMTNHFEKGFIRTVGSLYLLYMATSITTLALVSLHAIMGHIFLFLFLSWHLIPILFISLYLEKNHNMTTVVQEGFDAKLSMFADKYEISKREREVIQLISKGFSNQEISENLFISLQTVKDHIHRIFVKTGVKNRVQLTNMIRR